MVVRKIFFKIIHNNLLIFFWVQYINITMYNKLSSSSFQILTKFSLNLINWWTLLMYQIVLKKMFFKINHNNLSIFFSVQYINITMYYTLSIFTFQNLTKFSLNLINWWTLLLYQTVLKNIFLNYSQQFINIFLSSDHEYIYVW